jgi:Ca-activated chloride channel family protein
MRRGVFASPDPLRRQVTTMHARLFLRTLAVAAACAASLAAVAQPRAELAAPPWRAPTLVVSGAEQPVRLRALKVDVEVAAGVAETRVQMEFFNPNSRILEGKLQFPLGPGQVVNGFALDVEGQLRDAVPVEKVRAEQVFEDVARRRVDPGLLQTTVGNNYELRIYPLLPGKTRTIVLKLVEPAGQRLALPLGYAHRVEQLDVSLRYASATTRPLLASGGALGLAFAPDPRGGFVARASRADAVLPHEPLLIETGNGAAVQLSTQERDGDTFFALDLPIGGSVVPRPLPRRLQIVWDASGSGANRQIDRELALLDAYFKRAQTSDVTLVRFADVAAPPERFTVRRGDWRALRHALLDTVYDGASNLGAVRHDGVSNEAIWFSDGLANYGAPWHIAFPIPVYAVNSAVSSDPAALHALAEASGGRSIDLLTLASEQAVTALLSRGTELVEVTALGARNLVVESRDAASGHLAVAGILTQREAELTLHLRESNGTTTTRTIRVEARRNASRLAALQWARLSLAALAGEARTNQVRIGEIGRRFGMATHETSLIVLERVDDYVQNGIEPPPPLRQAYDRLAATLQRDRAGTDAARLANVVQRFEAHVAWWQRDFPKDTPKPRLEIAKSEARGAIGASLQAPRERQVADAMTSEAARTAAPMPMAPATNIAALAGAAPVSAKKDGEATSGGASISIALKPAATNAEWRRRLEAAEPSARLAIYLDERQGNAMSVGFFLDCADFFLQKGQREVGLRVLSNLAEMDLQNRQVLRLLAYRLQQAGALDLALPVFERVLELAPHEPQSHRDLGLALAQAGQPQAAVDRLYEVVTGSWDARFADIDLIALNELNAVVAKAARDGKPVDIATIEPRLLKNLPLDLRVVLAWDADATDVDLHVFDPNGEEVFYGHNLSYQGGTISHDATGGYGPEEFSLRHAKPGKYRVEANFFGHRQQVLTSSTGIMLWLSSGFATPAQQDQRTTLRLKSQGGERVVVGEFEVAG